MEQAIFISKAENSKFINAKYSRVYFGNEFCQRLIPSIEEIKRITDFVSKRKMGFTFVTPYVTNQGIDALRPNFEYLKQQMPEAEIVINDWGVFRIIKKEYNFSNILLGRLLTKQKRGPRILSVKDRVSEETKQHFRESNIDVPILSDFFYSQGIRRVELDNLLQGIGRHKPSLKGSLYYPFAYVTTTRYCISASAEEEGKSLRSIMPCNKECQRYTFSLHHKNMPVDLFLKGNTQLFNSGELPENLEELNIDRLVFQPEIPL